MTEEQFSGCVGCAVLLMFVCAVMFVVFSLTFNWFGMQDDVKESIQDVFCERAICPTPTPEAR